MTAMSRPFAAEITRPGSPGRSEPWAMLEDGKEMPLGWDLGKTLEVGQTGTAVYIVSGSLGLWKFTPQEEVGS